MSWPPPLSELILDGTVYGKARTAGSKKASVIRSTKAPNPRTGVPDGKMHPIVVPARDGGTTAKAIIRDSSDAAGEEWRADIRNAVTQVYDHAAEGTLDVPLVLECCFFRERGTTMYGSGAKANTVKESAPAYPVARPDGTKLVRAFEDALTKFVWSDDSLIVSMRWDKRFIPLNETPHVKFALWRLPATVGDKRLVEYNQEQATLV